MSWNVILSKKAVKDSKKLKSAGLKPQAERLLGILSEDPFQSPPDYEKLVGNLNGFYSRRINTRCFGEGKKLSYERINGSSIEK